MFNGRFMVMTGESLKVVLANGGTAARLRASIANSGPAQVEVMAFKYMGLRDRTGDGSSCKVT